MEQTLSNTVRVVGNYENIPTSVTSVATVVTMIDGLSITKSADKKVWAEGNLKYTVIITNNTEKTYATPEVTDVLDTSLVTFVDGSVTIDDVSAEEDDYEYTEDTGTLKINLEDILASSSKTITFEVSKKVN